MRFWPLAAFWLTASGALPNNSGGFEAAAWGSGTAYNMASPQSAHQTWRSSQSTVSNSSALRMNDIPAELSPSQIEAQGILRHLLSRLKDPDSKYYARYGRWLNRHPRLDDICFRCVRPQVWSYLNGRWSLDAYVQTFPLCFEYQREALLLARLSNYDFRGHTMYSVPTIVCCKKQRIDEQPQPPCTCTDVKPASSS